MTDNTSDSSQYIHGNSADEQQRLSLLNDILNTSCLKELRLQEAEKVLDVGSGLGQYTRLIARTVGATGHVVGVERDPDQLAQARKLAEHSDEANLVDFRKGDALALPLDDSEWGTFDTVHARFLLEHVPRPAQVVAQMARAVRPGGRVYVCDDDHGNFRPWPEPLGFNSLWQAYIRSYDRLGNDPYVGRRLVSLLHDGGLTSITNGFVFFGGCAGNERFKAITDNLISALEGARQAMLTGDFLDEASFNDGIEGLKRWKVHPSAALWYAMSCAEGFVAD